MGMQVGGKRKLNGQGNIQFEIQSEKSKFKIIDAKVTVAGE
jgi:hypothetical protein